MKALLFLPGSKIQKFLVRGVMPDHVRVRRQEQGPCRARLAFIVTFLMAVLHLCSPCFSLSKNVSKSCQAAALGPAPNQEDLKKLDRALPTYMLKTTGWDEQMAMKRWTETLKWRCEIDDDKVVQRPNPDFFLIHPHYPTYLHLEDRGGRLTYWEILASSSARCDVLHHIFCHVLAERLWASRNK